MRKFISNFSISQLSISLSVIVASLLAFDFIFRALQIDHYVLKIICIGVWLALCFYMNRKEQKLILKEVLLKDLGNVPSILLFASILICSLFAYNYSREAFIGLVDGGILLQIILRYSEFVGIETRKQKELKNSSPNF